MKEINQGPRDGIRLHPWLISGLISSMRTVSKKYFAKLCGVSGAAITKAAQAGRIGLDGKYVNLDDPTTDEYFKKKTGVIPDVRPQQAKKSKPEKLTTPPPPPKEVIKQKSIAPAPAKQRKIDSEPSEQYEMMDLTSLSDHDLGLLGISELDRMKTIEQTLKIRQDREVSRGELIPRKIVRAFCAKLHAIDSAEFKTMEDRLAPAICGLFGEPDDTENALEIRKLLNKEITNVLRHAKRLINDYLTRAGSEAL